VHRDSHVAKWSILIFAESAFALLAAVSLNHVNAGLEHARLLGFDFAIVTGHRLAFRLATAAQ
jgi:hypothetical protein